MLSIMRCRSAAAFLLPLAVLIAAAAGCAEKKPKVSIEDTKVEHSRSSAGELNIYMKMKNEGAADTLRNIRSSLRGAAAFMTASEDNRGARIEQIAVPADGTVEFRSGGNHIVIGSMPRETGPGDQFTLILVFDKTGEKSVQLTIPRMPGRAGGPSDGKGMTVRD